MRFKLNTFLIFNETIKRILDGWEEACRRAVSMDYEPTVTSGMDGTHSQSSGHYYGRSVDFRSNDVPFELRQNLKQAAQEVYGPDYLVLLEEDHFHVQRNKNTF